MNHPKFDTYVAVFFGADKITNVKFVTALGEGSMVHWNAGEPAKPFSESFAREIVYGLTINGYAAAVIKVLHGVELSNHKAD